MATKVMAITGADAIDLIASIKVMFYKCSVAINLNWHNSARYWQLAQLEERNSVKSSTAVRTKTCFFFRICSLPWTRNWYTNIYIYALCMKVYMCSYYTQYAAIDAIWKYTRVYFWRNVKDLRKDQRGSGEIFACQNQKNNTYALWWKWILVETVLDCMTYV